MVKVTPDKYLQFDNLKFLKSTWHKHFSGYSQPSQLTLSQTIMLLVLNFITLPVLGEVTLSGFILVVFFICLLAVVGFEFVNRFHDTANAVATVIYTKALKPVYAIPWSGFFNF